MSVSKRRCSVGRAVIIINRYPPSPNDVADIMEDLPTQWILVRTEEDAAKSHTRLIVEGANLPDQTVEFESATALLQAVCSV